jgi:hypothetical protein
MTVVQTFEKKSQFSKIPELFFFVVECWLVNAVREYLWLLHVTVKVRQIFGSEEKFESFSHLCAARRNRCCVVKGNVIYPKKLSPKSFETVFISVQILYGQCSTRNP